MPGDKLSAAGAAIVRFWSAKETDDVRSLDLADYLAWPHVNWGQIGKKAVTELLIAAGLAELEAVFVVEVVEIIHDIVTENPDCDILASVRAFVDDYKGQYDNRIQAFARAIGWTGTVEVPKSAATPAPVVPAPTPAPAAAAPAASTDPVEDAIDAFVAFVAKDDAKADVADLAAYVSCPTDKFDGKVRKDRLRPKLKAVLADEPRRFAEDLWSSVRRKVAEDPASDVMAVAHESADFQTGWEGRIQTLAKACGWTGAKPAAPAATPAPATGTPAPSATPAPAAAPAPQEPPEADPFASVPSAGGPPPTAPANSAPAASASNDSRPDNKGRGDDRRGKGRDGNREDQPEEAQKPPPPVILVDVASKRRQETAIAINVPFRAQLKVLVAKLDGMTAEEAEKLRIYYQSASAKTLFGINEAAKLARFVPLWRNFPAERDAIREEYCLYMLDHY